VKDGYHQNLIRFFLVENYVGKPGYNGLSNFSIDLGVQAWISGNLDKNLTNPPEEI